MLYLGHPLVPANEGPQLSLFGVGAQLNLPKGLTYHFVSWDGGTLLCGERWA